MALETYKILKNLAPVCLQNLLKIKHTKYSFRYSNILDIPQVRTTSYGKKSFSFAAASLWNSLPDHFRTASHILRVLFSPGVEQNVLALPIDN